MAQKETLSRRVTNLEDLVKILFDAQMKTEARFQETTVLFQEIRKQSDEREKRMDERIGKLVSAIGKLIGRQNGKH